MVKIFDFLMFVTDQEHVSKILKELMHLENYRLEVDYLPVKEQYKKNYCF